MSNSRLLESPFLRGPRLAQAPERPLHVLEPLEEHGGVEGGSRPRLRS